MNKKLYIKTLWWDNKVSVDYVLWKIATKHNNELTQQEKDVLLEISRVLKNEIQTNN